MTERELIERCRDGDRQAQREAYDRTSRHVYRLLLRMTGNEDDALEIAQDTYLRAFSRIHTFDGRSAFATWLYRIAFNEAVRFLKGAERTKSNLPVVAVDDRAESPDKATAARIDVNDALAALKPADRAILLFRYQESLDYRAIADAMECTEGTVASRLNRARRRLRELLQESYESGEETKHADHPKDVWDVSMKGEPDLE